MFPETKSRETLSFEGTLSVLLYSDEIKKKIYSYNNFRRELKFYSLPKRISDKNRFDVSSKGPSPT